MIYQENFAPIMQPSRIGYAQQVYQSQTKSSDMNILERRHRKNISNNQISNERNANKLMIKKINAERIKKNLSFNGCSRKSSNNMLLEQQEESSQKLLNIYTSSQQQQPEGSSSSSQYYENYNNNTQMEYEQLYCNEQIQNNQIQQDILIQSYRSQSENYNNRNILNSQYGQYILSDMLKNDHYFSPRNQLQNHQITAPMRAKMVDWMIEVMASYKCTDQTFFLSINLMDRYFQNATSQQIPNDLHIIGVTTMFLACKYEEIYPIRLKTVHEKIAHKKLQIEEIKNKEAQILSDLSFDITGPTIFDFIQIILNELKLDQQGFDIKTMQLIENICIYLAKMTIHNYDLIKNLKNSQLAAGCIFVAFKILEQCVFQDINLNSNMVLLKNLLNIEESLLINIATNILNLAKNFENQYPNLKNLKKFNMDLINNLEAMQAKKNQFQQQQQQCHSYSNNQMSSNNY